MRSRYILSVHLLVALLLNADLTSCEDGLTENADISAEENLPRPEVRIPQGEIQGVNLVTRLKRKFFGFQGIPYAQPPVGDLRFKGPVPAAAWNGTWDGSIISDPCPQPNGTAVYGNEDCLYTNVFTPQLPLTENSTLLPVMVFIFGGKFVTGTNSPIRYGPEYILDKDVVLVVPNYRMGILGYLSTGDEISPGNYALKDLVIALKWIQDNIRYFGGDPDRVTIMGGSSGAICVHLLTLSNLTEGLFHRYITDSGSALSTTGWQPRQTCTKRATQLGEYLGCPTNTSTILVECLRGFSASQLVNSSSIFTVWNGFPVLVWGPTVEPEMEGAFITDTPVNLYAAGKFRDLPWLESLTRDEGIVFGGLFYDKPSMYQPFFDNLDTLLPIVLHYDGTAENKKICIDAWKSYYFGNLTADTNSLLTNLTKLAGDAFMVYPSYRLAQQKLIHAKQPHYLCSFEYRGTVSYSYMFTGGSTKNWGVAHGDELLYLLPGLKSLFGPPGWEFDGNDWEMVDTLVQLWTSFVINGTPTVGDSNGTVVWEPYSSRHNYLRIGNGSDTTLEAAYDLHSDRMRFWDELSTLDCYMGAS